MAKKLTHDELLAHMRKIQGERSLRCFAEELEVSAAFLSDVFLGRRAPGRRILDKLGFRKNTTVTTVYEKIA